MPLVPSALRNFVKTVDGKISGPTQYSDMSGDWRLEMKFAIPFRMEPTARLQLSRNQSAFRTAYPPRIVINIYFDTVDQQAVRSNFAGIGDRAKVRLRWYGDLTVANDPVLEVKIKNRGAGSKLYHSMPGVIDLAEMSWSDLRHTISKGAEPAVAKHWESTRQAMLFNSYHRRYFETYDRKVRATIDTDIRARAQRETTRPKLEFNTPASATIVVELKASVANESELRAVVKGLGWRVGRHSKYVRGIFGRIS